MSIIENNKKFIDFIVQIIRILHNFSFCYYSRMSTNHNLRKGLLDFLETETQESIDDEDNSENKEEEIYKSDHDTQSGQSDDEIDEALTSKGEFFWKKGKEQKIHFKEPFIDLR